MQLLCKGDGIHDGGRHALLCHLILHAHVDGGPRSCVWMNQLTQCFTRHGLVGLRVSSLLQHQNYFGNHARLYEAQAMLRVGNALDHLQDLLPDSLHAVVLHHLNHGLEQARFISTVITVAVTAARGIGAEGVKHDLRVSVVGLDHLMHESNAANVRPMPHIVWTVVEKAPQIPQLLEPRVRLESPEARHGKVKQPNFPRSVGGVPIEQTAHRSLFDTG
mmetsp:Transcript_88953/g.207029  ORF Transcript_88953/g.207029 Transcript_88953/m.207029 type:complete len:219 (+) Transcript_88953:357-1013(+)